METTVEEEEPVAVTKEQEPAAPETGAYMLSFSPSHSLYCTSVLTAAGLV